MATSAYAQSTITDIGTIDATTVVPGKPPGYSPYAGRNFPSRVFWGDTHLHTSASLDAGAFGNRLGFEDAYRFARGEELTASGGERVKLSRPLDFLVIADHSDNMGFFPPSSPEARDARRPGPAAMVIWSGRWRGRHPPALQFLPGSEVTVSTWEQIIAAAEKYNEPSRFTSFIGYEWTSQVPPGNNLHRVVICREKIRRGQHFSGRSLQVSVSRRRATAQGNLDGYVPRNTANGHVAAAEARRGNRSTR